MRCWSLLRSSKPSQTEKERTWGRLRQQKKKTGLRKPLFSVAGGSNSKFVQVLMSPRNGGGARPVEEKGPSYPSYLNLKILCYGDGRVFLVLFFLLFQ